MDTQTDHDHPETDKAAAWPATRAEALRRLERFVPLAGRAYASKRNYDFGPGQHEAVSVLSPFIRHRLISEEEVVRAVRGAHSYQTAEKFIQEVLWRTYWKGWLEMRHSVWHSYTAERDALERTSAIEDAEAGRTGIACFDGWARELVETGYLHNHARMWFASIWIFTLGLPWAAGADFFMRHLLDGDPASNTLGWRWVAGIQTRGKTYLARPDNITRYTEGRFGRIQGLAEDAPALEDANAPGKPVPPAPTDELLTDGPVALVLHGDDLSGTDLLPKGMDVTGVLALDNSAARSTLPTSLLVSQFAHGAAHDALARAEQITGVPGQYMEGRMVSEAADWILASGAKSVIAPYAPVGPEADGLAALRSALDEKGLALHIMRRDWDSHFWPHATKGFFPFKEKIPGGLRMLGLE